MIYADNAATTKLDIDAFEAMKPFLLNEYGNASQPYSFSREPRRAIKEARETIAKCIGADSNEIFFTSCGTESDNWAIRSIMSNKKHMFTSKIEHHAVLETCKVLSTQGKIVEYIPVLKNGVVDLERFREMLTDSNVDLISVMMANNEVGSIQPIKTLAKKTHEKGAIFHTDAVQAVGHIEVDVKELGVDLLSASAHKFNGPKGIGFLYIRKGIPVMPYMTGGNQENRMRAGTENIASIVGMAKALEKNCTHIPETMIKLLKLEKIILSELKQADVDFIRNGSDYRIPGNLNLSFKGFIGEALLHRLDLMGICVSTGSACDSVNTQISHVMKALSVPKEYAKGTIRISLGRENTDDDAHRIAYALTQICKNQK